MITEEEKYYSDEQSVFCFKYMPKDLFLVHEILRRKGMIENDEFRVHILNDEGIKKANQIATIFDSALALIESLVPQGRYLSLMKTKMEEGCFFAKKGMAQDPINQLNYQPRES